MEVTLTRIKMKEGKQYQIGHLVVDGKYVCDTIEDVDRGLTQDMPLEKLKAMKVKSKTAIPKGRYRVTLNIRSPKFYQKPYYKAFCNGYVPRLLEVPAFEGILIHKGVNENSSAGCIIVGKNDVVGKVTHSQECFEKLYKILNEAKERKEAIWITIK